MNARQVVATNATSVDPETMLYFYHIHKRFHLAFSSLLCWVCIIIFCFTMLEQAISIDETFLSVQGENKLQYLFIFLLCIKIFNVAWIITQHHYILTIQHKDMLRSRCTCAEPHRLVYLIGATCELIYIRPCHGRLEIGCPYCKKIIYAHDIEKSNLFEKC